MPPYPTSLTATIPTILQHPTCSGKFPQGWVKAIIFMLQDATANFSNYNIFFCHPSKRWQQWQQQWSVMVLWWQQQRQHLHFSLITHWLQQQWNRQQQSTRKKITAMMTTSEKSYATLCFDSWLFVEGIDNTMLVMTSKKSSIALVLLVIINKNNNDDNKMVQQ